MKHDCTDFAKIDCTCPKGVCNYKKTYRRIEFKGGQYPHREICGLCHRVSPVGFWVPNDIWEAVVHSHYLHSIHCLSCFIERADEKLINWSKEIKFYPVSLRSHIDEVLTKD